MKMASNDKEDSTGDNFYETYKAQFSEHHLLDTEDDCNLVVPAVVYEENDGTSDEPASQDSMDEESGEPTTKPRKTPRELRKLLKNAGKEFVNAAGKLVPAKVFIDKPCGCKQGCATVISAQRRERLFKDYYKISWEEKTAFIKNHIQLKHVNRRYSKNGNFRRTFSRVYRLPDENGALRIVCKQFFIDTLAVSCKRVNGALLRNVIFGEIEPDRRGRQKRIKEEDETFAHEFISRLPTYELDGVKYLTNESSVMGMHKHYKEKCEKLRKPPVSIFYFRKLFSSKFQLLFRPRSRAKIND